MIDLQKEVSAEIAEMCRRARHSARVSGGIDELREFIAEHGDDQEFAPIVAAIRAFLDANTEATEGDIREAEIEAEGDKRRAVYRGRVNEI